MTDIFPSAVQAARDHAALLRCAAIVREGLLCRAGETITAELATERANNCAQALSDVLYDLADAARAQAQEQTVIRIGNEINRLAAQLMQHERQSEAQALIGFGLAVIDREIARRNDRQQRR